MSDRKIASMDIAIGNFDIPIDLYKAVSDDKEDLKIITDCCGSPRKLKYLCSKMILIKVVQQPLINGPGTQPGPFYFP